MPSWLMWRSSRSTAWANWLAGGCGPADAHEGRLGFLIRHAKDGAQGERPGFR